VTPQRNGLLARRRCFRKERTDPEGTHVSGKEHLKILVVEDDSVSRSSLVELLNREGHKAFGVEEGWQAVAACEVMLPELLILDYRLPDMTGLEVLARVGEHAELPPAIMVTGHLLSVAARHTAESHGVRIFQKPILAREFLQSVRTIAG
jgi:DNA-binding response OmpR family regulator